MKYKKGDIVKIKKCEVWEWYGELVFMKEMKKCIGKTAKITKVWKDNYYLDIDNGRGFWTDEMLEPVEEKEKNYKSVLDHIDGKYKKKKKVNKPKKDKIIQIISRRDSEYDSIYGLSESGKLYKLYSSMWFEYCDSPLAVNKKKV